MKVISIRQPWATLVCGGAKTIENRTWQTSHRGLLAIHTGAFQKASNQLVPSEVRDSLYFGGIIGTVELREIVEREDISDNPWAEGPLCFVFENPKLFRTPFAHKGRVSISTLPDEIADRVVEHSRDCIDVGSDPKLQAIFRAISPGKIDKSLLRRVESFGGMPKYTPPKNQ